METKVVKRVSTTQPSEKDLGIIRTRDKRCVYCGKEMKKSGPQSDWPTIEHLNHKQDWDSVGEYMREGKPVPEIVAIACWGCNTSRGAKSLRSWFECDYCTKNDIKYETVDDVVKRYIDKYEK